MTASRPRSLRSRLTRTLVGLGLISVLLLATVNFFMVRSLLNEGVRNQLTSLRELRSQSIERGVESSVLGRVAALAQDPGVSAALEDLAGGYDSVDVELDATELDELRAVYEPILGLYDDAGVPRPGLDDLIPSSASGRYTQYHYVAKGEGDATDDAGDGSGYSEAHAEHHPYLRAVRDELGVDDLLLVAADSNEVVYSVEKRVDLGTDVVDGPYREGSPDRSDGLGEVYGRLEETGVAEAALVDGRFHLPTLGGGLSGAEPLVHVAAKVRSDSRVIGAFVVTIPIAVLTDIVTASGNWELLGLGDTGDAYVVGSDFTLRTIPRGWSEDPDGFVEDYLSTGGDDEVADLMRLTDSPVRLQTVDNEAIETALEGETFLGRVASYHDRETLATAAPLDIDGVDWVLVAEQETGETRDELERYLVSVGIVLAALVPVLALVGALIARALARPVGPLVDSAGAIAEGDYEHDVPTFGRNELGDVARQLGLIGRDLAERQRTIEAEEARIGTMLGSVVPDELVDRVRRGDLDAADLVDTGTVIAISVTGVPEASGADQDDVLDLTSRLSDELSALAGRRGVERLRVAADEQLFVVGRHRPGALSATAAEFAVLAIEQIRQLGEEFGIHLDARAGLSVGRVATGVLGSQQLSFGVWGDAFNRALTLATDEGTGGVLADASVLDELDESWDVERVDPERDVFSVRRSGVDVPG